MLHTEIAKNLIDKGIAEPLKKLLKEIIKRKKDPFSLNHKNKKKKNLVVKGKQGLQRDIKGNVTDLSQYCHKRFTGFTLCITK